MGWKKFRGDGPTVDIYETSLARTKSALSWTWHRSNRLTRRHRGTGTLVPRQPNSSSGSRCTWQSKPVAMANIIVLETNPITIFNQLSNTVVYFAGRETYGAVCDDRSGRRLVRRWNWRSCPRCYMQRKKSMLGNCSSRVTGIAKHWSWRSLKCQCSEYRSQSCRPVQAACGMSWESRFATFRAPLAGSYLLQFVGGWERVPGERMYLGGRFGHDEGDTGSWGLLHLCFCD